METLKKFFPLSWKYAKEVADLVIGVIIYVVAAVIASAVIWLATLVTAWIPVVGGLVGIVLGLLGTLVDIYAIAGIVILFLVKFNVIKQ